ncbi:hypothetical protein ILYODFUR_029433 [Ilyodon furcidens]|uniref:Uncharacterized protein n=1 Tax=Ilyodon furcidens TaxID=33524 RepID=A0ABV0UK17_9TELE
MQSAVRCTKPLLNDTLQRNERRVSMKRVDPHISAGVVPSKLHPSELTTRSSALCVFGKILIPYSVLF